MDHWTVTDPKKIDQFWHKLLDGQTEDWQDWFEENGDSGATQTEAPVPLSNSYTGKRGGGVSRDLSAEGEIRPYEPNRWGQVEEFLKQNGLGHFIYNLTLKNIDDIWIMLQSLCGRTYPAHLNDHVVSSQEKLDAGIGTLTNLFFWNCGELVGISKNTVNASQFNRLYQGTGITAASQGEAFICQHNYIIRNNNEFITISNFTGHMSNFVTSYKDIMY